VIEKKAVAEAVEQAAKEKTSAAAMKTNSVLPARKPF